MDIRIYTPDFAPVAVTHAASNIKYTEKFYTFGDFEITIPSGANGASAFKKYLYVNIDNVFWGVILELERKLDIQGDMLTVSGVDLKGLTLARYTVPPTFSDAATDGTAGFDAVTGTTEYCMKHYMRSNFFPAASPSRSVQRLIIAPDRGRGRPDDRYMSRFEPLSAVIEGLGEAAELGYAMVPDVEAGTITFDCVEGVNHSAEQSENPRVIFSIERGNIESMTYQDSDSNMRNLFYTTMSGSASEDEAYTAAYTRDDISELPAGIYRWEQHMDISAEHPEPGREYDELKRLALIRAESYRTVSTLTANVLERGIAYRRNYNLGDIVTVENRAWGMSINPRVTEMSVQASQSGVTYSATFGKAEINPLARLRRQIRGG